VLRATDDTALVVGNPKVSDQRFPSLKGARDEAEAVATVLRDIGKYDVNLLLEEAATPTAVLDGLHERPLRILHLAAHGVFEFEHVKGKRVSGLVLGDGTFFTAAEADQMRYVPELVFINCCFLGKTTGDAREHARYDRLAANLDHHDGIHEMPGHQLADQLLLFHVDREGVLLVAVDNGGHAAIAAQIT